ncbi:MAG: 30S ribosomal protein S9 [Candidatus Wildermuthbacteria bacterium]|nr:30S ribosomal protein S9 [Candidatus Wildermuthbacteria bacterium]
MPRTKAKSQTEGSTQEKIHAPSHYYEGIGRRKTAIARVRISDAAAEKTFLINQKSPSDYFQENDYTKTALDSLEKTGLLSQFGVSVLVQGGGKEAQAEAIRHGLARALVQYNSDLRTQLKGLGFLTRDPRAKERKKFGLRGARRARQWRKR